jgi:hypothetical protein
VSHRIGGRVYERMVAAFGQAGRALTCSEIHQWWFSNGSVAEVQEAIDRLVREGRLVRLEPSREPDPWPRHHFHKPPVSTVRYGLPDVVYGIPRLDPPEGSP